MNKQTSAKLFLLTVLLTIPAFSVFAQTKELLKRTTYKMDKLDFASAGTLVVVGAPSGSISVEGWNKNEVEISAEIEIQAETESDIEQITAVTGFVLEESFERTAIISVGVHDKKYLKDVAKRFPEHLVGLPFRIDYIIKVPQFCDLQIAGGNGDLYMSGVEGKIKINYLKGNARLHLIGGGIVGTFGSGSVEVSVLTRSREGSIADIQLATGTMNVSLPPSMHAELNASILRTGKIENTYPDLKPRTKKNSVAGKLIAAKLGAGGRSMKFTVGDGTLNIFELRKPE